MTISQQNSLRQHIQDQHDRFVSWLRERKLGVDDFTKDPRYARYKEDALFLRNLRNLAAHNSLKYVDVLETAIERIDHFVSEITSPSLEPVMIPLRKLYVAKMRDKVLPAMRILRDKNYSYLPIINDRKVCEDVFSSYILMSYLCLGKEIDESTTFTDIFAALANEPLDETCEYLPIKSPIIAAMNTFKVTSDFHLDVVLVTEDGDSESPLLGMITVWDL